MRAGEIGCVIVLAAGAGAGAARAHSVTQRVGAYQDTDGMTRQRAALEATVDGRGRVADMSAQSVSLTAIHDVYSDDEVGDADDAYQREIYGESRRVNDSVAVTANQTWDRITDTRVMGSYATDRHVRTRTWAVGVSQWLAHETVRVGVDLSRTVVEQPLYEILDYDSREIGNPTVASSVGATLAVRHLATPTTIADYTASHVELENRPPINAGTVAVRQFIPKTDAAVHVSATRADNRGYVTTETIYGQVDAWIFTAAYLQSLWRGGRGRVAYRYYEEDEVTRAYGDQRQLGSDTVTLALSQELGEKIAVDAAGSRYANNDGTQARTLEMGVTAKF